LPGRPNRRLAAPPPFSTVAEVVGCLPSAARTEDSPPLKSVNPCDRAVLLAMAAQALAWHLGVDMSTTAMANTSEKNRCRVSGNLRALAAQAENPSSSLSVDLSRRDQPGEVEEGAIVAALGVGREEAAWQLPSLEMITDTLATESLARARLVAARALLGVLGLSAIHRAPGSKRVKG